MNRVMIAIPAYEGKIGYPLMLAISALLRRRDDVGLVAFPGRASLSLVRDEIAATFLASKADRLLMMDSDIHCTPDDIQLLLDNERDVVSACVRPRPGVKLEESQAYTGELIGGAKEHIGGARQNECLKALYLPCSMLSVGRKALTAANNWADAYPVKKKPESAADWCLNFFPCGVVTDWEGKRRFLTEAYYFSHILRKASVNLWIDFSVIVGHGGHER